MRSAARLEGHKFLETLSEEWASGENRFDQEGEMLCGALEQGVLIAVAGLNRDPFVTEPKVGRIRRVYVMQSWRNKGLGAAMVNKLVTEARSHFRSVRLRADSPAAARLYERLGFAPVEDAHATHSIYL